MLGMIARWRALVSYASPVGCRLIVSEGAKRRRYAACRLVLA
jgi:hypothetical protein